MTKNKEDVRVEVTRYELFNQTFRYFNIFLRDCSFPPHTHHHHLTSESIDPSRKRKVFQLKIAQFIHHSQDRTLSTQYVWNTLQKFQPFYATLPHSPTSPRWSNWVKTEKFSSSPSKQLFHLRQPSPSLSNLINDNQIRNSNWAIIRSSIMWQHFCYLIILERRRQRQK